MQPSPFFRFWSMLRQYRIELRSIYAYAIFNGLVNLSLPLGIQAIINYIQAGEMSSSWVVLVFFVLLGIAATGWLQIMQLRIVENIQQDIFARSAFEFAYRFPKIKFMQLDRVHAPELVNRFFDTLTIQKGLPKILIDFSLASFQIVFGLVLLAIYSPYFIILGFTLIFLIWLIVQITGPRGLETSLKESKVKYQLAHWLEEIGRVNRSFKIYASGKLHLTKTDAIASNYISAREKHFQVLLNQFRYFIGFKVVVAAALLLLGGMLVFEEQMNIGQFVAAEIIIILIINSVEKLLRVIETIYDVLTGLEKIGYVTDLSLDEDTGFAVIDSPKAIAIDGVDVGFGFPNMPQRILNNLSFSIPSGARVVVNGETGTGKSTLLQLMAGIHTLSEGEIYFNGIPLSNYNREKLYEKIGVAFPTNQLFEGTICDNITMGRPIPDKRLSEIVEVLGLSHYIAHQPKGIHSFVDSGGRRLPRSIIQRILVARTLIGKPQVLLLEDPLQFVHETEKNRIIDYIMDKKHDWTVIVVADNPRWIEKSTQVIELTLNKSNG